MSIEVEHRAIGSLSPLELASRKRTIMEQVLARGPSNEILGGIVAEPVTGPSGELMTIVHIGNPYRTEPAVYSFLSPLSVDEVAAVRSRIFPIPEAYEILETLAMGHTLRCPVIIEGDPSVGKTFLIARFTELLIGLGQEPVDFYCHANTETSDLQGKWTPEARQDDLRASWASLLASCVDTGHDEETVVVDVARLTDLAVESAVAATKGMFGFELGAIPKAMMHSALPNGGSEYYPGGAGKPLHIEEVGNAKAGVIASLLELRGDGGKLTDGISLHDFDGSYIPAGPLFNLFMSTNPPDGAGMLQRTEINSALANGLVWARVPALSGESIRLCAQEYFRYQGTLDADSPNRIVNLKFEPEVAQLIADLVGKFHREFDALSRQSEPGRAQVVPVTLRDLAMAAEYINTFQVCDRGGDLDLVDTVRNAIDFVYLGKIRDDKTHLLAKKQFETLLSQSATASIVFRGKNSTVEHALKILQREIVRKGSSSFSLSTAENYSAIRERLSERSTNKRFRGGLYAESVFYGSESEPKTVVHIGNPFKATSMPIISFVTPLSVGEVEELRDSLYPIQEGYEILETLALAYRLRAPALLEGDTSIGKSHVVKCFTKLLTGSSRCMEDFYCSVQTDVTSLVGKWTPTKASPSAEEKWREFIVGEFGQRTLQSYLEEVQPLVKSRRISPEMAAAMVHRKIRSLAKSSGIFADQQSFKFQPGALLRAMTASEGEGCVLHIEEVGCAHPSLHSALLWMGGENGRTSTSLQLHEDRGGTIQAGPKFFLVMSTNPSGDPRFKGVSPIDAALASRVRYRYVRGLRDESAIIAAEHALARNGRHPEERPAGCVLEFYRFPDLCAVLAEVVGPVHQKIRTAVNHFERGRRQQIPVTTRSLEMLVNYMIQVQSIGDTGQPVDLIATLKNGLERIYLKPHIKEVRDAGIAELTAVLDAKVDCDGEQISRREKIERLVARSLAKPDEPIAELITHSAAEAEMLKRVYALEDEIVEIAKLPLTAAMPAAEALAEAMARTLDGAQVPELVAARLLRVLGDLIEIRGGGTGGMPEVRQRFVA